MNLSSETASIPSILTTTIPTATIESTATLTSEYQSTRHSTVSQMITTASNIIVESVATLTTTYQSTYRATLGSTITITPPPISWSLQPSTTAWSLVPPSATVTVTEVAITIIQPDNTFVSTLTLPVITAHTTAFPPSQPSPYVVVVGPHDQDHRWNSWSSAQKGGLIAGVVLAFLLTLACLLLWYSSRKRTWIANDWSVNSHSAWGIHQPGQLVTQGHNSWGLRGGGGNRINIWKRVKLEMINGGRQQQQFLRVDRDLELEELCVTEQNSRKDIRR